MPWMHAGENLLVSYSPRGKRKMSPFPLFSSRHFVRISGGERIEEDLYSPHCGCGFCVKSSVAFRPPKNMIRRPFSRRPREREFRSSGLLSISGSLFTLWGDIIIGVLRGGTKEEAADINKYGVDVMVAGSSSTSQSLMVHHASSSRVSVSWQPRIRERVADKEVTLVASLVSR